MPGEPFGLRASFTLVAALYITAADVQRLRVCCWVLGAPSNPYRCRIIARSRAGRASTQRAQPGGARGSRSRPPYRLHRAGCPPASAARPPRAAPAATASLPSAAPAAGPCGAHSQYICSHSWQSACPWRGRRYPPLDKPNRADRDHVVLCAVPCIVFLQICATSRRLWRISVSRAVRRLPRPFADRQRPRAPCPAGADAGRTRFRDAAPDTEYALPPPAKTNQKMPSIHTTSRKCMPGMGNSILSFGWRTPVWRRGSPCRRRFGAVQRRGAHRRGRPHGR